MAVFWRVKNSSKRNDDVDHKVRKQQRRIRKLLIISSCLFVIIIGPSFVNWTKLSFEERALDRQLSELDARWESLTKEHERLESDPAYVEGLVRTTFKYGKPGEYVVKLDADEVYGTVD